MRVLLRPKLSARVQSCRAAVLAVTLAMLALCGLEGGRLMKPTQARCRDAKLLRSILDEW
jgi:hypothetical protein